VEEVDEGDLAGVVGFAVPMQPKVVAIVAGGDLYFDAAERKLRKLLPETETQVRDAIPVVMHYGAATTCDRSPGARSISN
jgi:hypothetical protein